MERLKVTDYDVVESRKIGSIFSLATYLCQRNLIGTPIDTMVTDLAKKGGLLVAGGEVRGMMGSKIESRDPDSNSISKFENGIGMHVPLLDIDFRRSLILFREDMTHVEYDLDLISPHVRDIAISFLANLEHDNMREHCKKGNLRATMADKPLRLSIFTPPGSTLAPFKIDITHDNPEYNARFRDKGVTTFDGTFFPVDKNLNVLMDMLSFNRGIPLEIQGGTDTLIQNLTDPVNLAILLRVLVQSRIATGNRRVDLHFGKTLKDELNTHKWMIASMAYIILNKKNNPNLYHRLLYTVIPSWDLFDARIQTSIKYSFIVAEKVNAETI